MDDKQVIKEYFEAVDEKLQKLIISSVTKNKIERIIQKYPLSEEQGVQLGNEINLVLLGIETINNFRPNLVNELGITYDQALKLSYTVNEEIFSGVMEELKEIEFVTTEVKEGRMIAEDEEEETEEGSAPEDTAPARNEFLEKQTRPAGISPDHMIPDHEAMEVTDGPHLHSQTIMPQTEGGMGTIIDQKLSRIFKNKAEPEEVINQRKERYKGNDPYREPVN